MADESVPSKRVDEDWKRRVADEKRQQEERVQAQPARSPAASAPQAPTTGPKAKEAPGAAGKEKPQEPRADKPGGRADPRFLQFLQGVAAQALMALGQIEHPATGQPEQDLRQAKMVIDTLLMLEEKTRGNLTREEEQAVKGLLQELQSIYVQLAV